MTLCETCASVRKVTSGSGSQFLLCERSRKDSSYPRYARQPVMMCKGYRKSNGKDKPRVKEAESPDQGLR